MKRSEQRLKCGLLLSGLLVWGCGGDRSVSQSANIFGDDDRQELDVAEYPGRALGRLDGGCSGAMIGKDLVVTAAHCIYDTDSSSLRDDVQYFRAGYRNGNAKAQAWIAAVWFGSKTPVENRRDDWAILQLAEPIGEDTGWFGVSEVDIASQLPFTVNMAGYAADRSRGELPYWHSDCYIHKIDEQERHLHDCDGVTGVSGGPVYTMGASGAKLVALTVSEFRTGAASMQRDRYSHEYANIAIAVQDVARVAGDLRSALDAGRTPGPLASVHHLVNLNANRGASESDGDVDQGEGQIEESGQALVPDQNDVQRRDRIWTNATVLVSTAVYVHEAAANLTDVAHGRHQTVLRNLARQVMVDSEQLVRQAEKFALQPRTSGLYYPQMLAALDALMAAESRLNTYTFPSRGGAVASARAEQMVRSIQSACQRLEDVTNSL